MTGMSKHNLVPNQNAFANTVDSIAVKRGSELLDRLSRAPKSIKHTITMNAEVIWTFIGYGFKDSGHEDSNNRHPVTQPVSPDTIPDELKERPQWVCWDWSWRNTYWGKPPVSAVTRGGAFENDPRTWTSFEDAWTFAVQHGLPGIGYVFDRNDPYTGIDIDHCRDPHTGAINIDGMAVVSALNSYTEISPSGEGLHILVHGKLGESFNRKKKILPERFDRDHYFTMTGQHFTGTPTGVLTRREELRELPQKNPDRTYSDTGTNRDEPSIREIIALNDLLLVSQWDGFINALDIETGSSRWKYRVGTKATLEASANSQLFIVTQEYLISIAALTGRETWRKPLDWNFTCVYAHMGMLFLYDDDAALQVLDATTGNLRWTFDSDDARFNVWIAVSITADTVCITGYNDEISELQDQDDLFHTCVLDATLGLQRTRTRSAGDDIARIDDLYSDLHLSPVLKRWSEYDRASQQTKSQSTRFGFLAASESNQGIACYDYRTDEELWVFQEADTDFPIITTSDTAFVSLQEDAACIVAIAANSGTEIWRFKTRATGWAYPVASTNGIVYVLERTHPTLFALTVGTGDMLWSLPLQKSLDRCLDINTRTLNKGEYPRNLYGHIKLNTIYISTGHALCAVRLPNP